MTFRIHTQIPADAVEQAFFRVQQERMADVPILNLALSVEAAELVEHFQWLTPQQCECLDRVSKRAVGEEIADVLLYLTRLADVLDIDPVAAARRKMKVNARKYPVRRARGNARKYNAG